MGNTVNVNVNNGIDLNKKLKLYNNLVRQNF